MAATSKAPALSNALKTYNYQLGDKTVSMQFADDKAERLYRRENPYSDYSKAKEMKYLSDIDKMSASNSGISDLQMAEQKRLAEKWNYQSSIKAPPSRHNSNQTIPDYLAMTPDMIKQAMNGYTSGGDQYYDPSKDSVYNSMVELSQKQADKAGLQAMESMNDRGILNSTITADRVGQIKQGASDAVLASIPGLAANFDNKQQANKNGLANLLSTVLGAGQFQQTFAEDNLRFDKNYQLDEAKLTGRYTSLESKAAMDELASAMAVLQSKTSTNEQKIVAQQKADKAKQALSVNNINATGVTNDMNYNQMLGKISSLAAPTLDWRDQVHNQQLDKDKLALDRDKLTFDKDAFYKELAYKKDTFGQELDFKKDSFNREMNFTEQNAMIEADLKGRGLDIDMFRAQIDQFNSQSDAEYKAYQRELGVKEQTAITNTNAAIAEISKAKNVAEAFEFMSEAGSSWAKSGVDMREVLRAIESRFPEAKSVTGSTTGAYGTP